MTYVDSKKTSSFVARWHRAGHFCAQHCQRGSACGVSVYRQHATQACIAPSLLPTRPALFTRGACCGLNGDLYPPSACILQTAELDRDE